MKYQSSERELLMKQYSLFLITFCFALFDTQCSEEKNNNFAEVFPIEITERILFFAFINLKNQFPFFILTAQKVCWAWRNLVLKNEKIAPFLEKYSLIKKQNQEFFGNYNAYISGCGDCNNPPDYGFFDSSLFDVTTAPRYLLSGFKKDNFDAVEQLIKKDDKILNYLLLNETCIDQMINWDFDECCLKTPFRRNTKKIIIDYIARRASFVSDEARLNLFGAFISDRMSNYSILRELLPVLKIEKSENSEYYFRFILDKIIKMDLYFEEKFDKLISKQLDYEDNRFNQYLLILVTNKAYFSLLDQQKDVYRQQILNIKHFPEAKETLLSILQSQEKC